FGNFSSLGENDMILRNTHTGGVEVYDLSNNQITAANFMGTVGLNRQFSGVGNFSGRGTSDMILRDSNTGGLEVYDINNNQITGAARLGQIGLDWQLGGLAADPPAASGAFADIANDQLVQAMAGFGGTSGAAADGLNAGLGSADTSQQP